MTGRIIDYQGGYYTVHIDDPPHEQKIVLHLRAWQVRGAQVGDRVLLRYETTSSSGLWNVVQVL